ncbi:hypothetical protein [Ignatzschineria sp. LJL83]
MPEKVFNEYELHDCLIHGYQMIYEELDRELIIDIGYILEAQVIDLPFQFLLTKAKLRFKNLSRLNTDHLNLESQFIYKITKEPENSNVSLKRYLWKIYLEPEREDSSPIVIKASDMVLEVSSKSVAVEGGRMYLYSSERKDL